MYYGTNELAQILESDGKVRSTDLISFKEPEKLNKAEIINCFYNNAYAISTHLYRLQSAKSIEPNKLRILMPIKTKIPRALVGVRLTTLLPGYDSSENVRDWWIDNLEKLDKKQFPAVSGGYLERVIGFQCRSFTSSLSIICDTLMSVDDLKLMVKVQRLLGINDDPAFYSNFKLIIPFKNLDGRAIREKRKVLTSIMEHQRRRVYLLSDGDLPDCIQTANEAGCRVAVWVEDVIQDGIPINLKHKIIDKIANLSRNNAGSSSNMLILTTEKKTSRLEKLVPYYAKNFGPVLIWKGEL